MDDTAMTVTAALFIGILVCLPLVVRNRYPRSQRSRVVRAMAADLELDYRGWRAALGRLSHLMSGCKRGFPVEVEILLTTRSVVVLVARTTSTTRKGRFALIAPGTGRIAIGLPRLPWRMVFRPGDQLTELDLAERDRVQHLLDQYPAARLSKDHILIRHGQATPATTDDVARILRDALDCAEMLRGEG